MPELYAVKGPGGNATAMAQGQLGQYDSWMAKGQRYDLGLWPLINVRLRARCVCVCLCVCVVVS